MTSPQIKQTIDPTVGRSTEEDNFFNQPTTATKNKLTTDSILALYGKTSSPNNMATSQFKSIIKSFKRKFVFISIIVCFYNLGQNNGFVPSQPQQPFFNAFNNNGFQTVQHNTQPINNLVCIYDMIINNISNCV